MRFLLFLLLLASCSSTREQPIRIGIDTTWYPLDFGPQTPFINGFVEDLLQEVAKIDNLTFERIDANPTTLYDPTRFDAILTSLPPHIYNRAKYDFSQNFLDLGLVLVVPLHSPHTTLSHLPNSLIGLLAPTPLLTPDQLPRLYPTAAALLTALADGEIEAALLPQVPAATYIADLFATRLKIVSSPLTPDGLHLIAPKGQHESLVHDFDDALSYLKQKKKIPALLKKWNLGS